MTKKPNRGRPITNPRLHELIKEHRCSRTWAYVLLRREQAQGAPKSIGGSDDLEPPKG